MVVKGKGKETVSFVANSNRSNKARWGNKSLHKNRSHRENENRHDNDSTLSGSVASWTSEKHVQSDEVFDGIEISMGLDGNGMELMHVIGTQSINHPPLTLQNEIKLATKQVSYKQMETNYHPACDFDTKHRIPIFNKSTGTIKLSMAKKLLLLGNYQTSNEESATRDEIQRNLVEMKNMENERGNIKQRLNLDFRLVSHKCCIPSCQQASDIDRCLDQVQENHGLKRYLQRRRGCCFHASFANAAFGQKFIKVCGGNRNDKTVHQALQDSDNEPYSVEKIAASASTVRHIAITKNNKETSFFISKDDGRAYWDECFPRRLLDRIGDEADSSSKALSYLSCGPKDTYYAKMDSGESFWSISPLDEEFKNVMDFFEAKRVAFGSFASAPSWIVIGENGKVAWKNLPCKLDVLLSKRTSAMASPSEVSLGDQGSYFIRFLDGEIDYCLPSHIAACCEAILKKGADITNIALHPESADAFIIRHTQIP